MRWARIGRAVSGAVPDCEAVGYPMWQQDASDDNNRSPAELRGAVRQLEDVTSRNEFLVLRDPRLIDVAPPRSARSIGDAASVWGGLSGALVFFRGAAIGIVVEHHPRQGAAARPGVAAGPGRRRGLRHRGGRRTGARAPTHRLLSVGVPRRLRALERAADDAADAALPNLRGRGHELDTLAALGGPGPPRWRWVRAASFAGKTALLATFVTHAPPLTTVVSCLLSRRKGRNSAQYLLDSLTMQLAAVAGRQGYIPPRLASGTGSSTSASCFLRRPPRVPAAATSY
jgi:hypothetical protein